MTEGVILYKLTFLLHAPLELYLVVKYFQSKSSSRNDHGRRGDRHDDEEGRHLGRGGGAMQKRRLTTMGEYYDLASAVLDDDEGEGDEGEE